MTRAERDRLVIENDAFAHDRAFKFYRQVRWRLLRNGSQLDRDDFVQAARIGMLEAAQRFDPKRGVKFIGYAVHWIRRRMQDLVLAGGTIRTPEGRSAGEDYERAAIGPRERSIADSRWQPGHAAVDAVRLFQRATPRERAAIACTVEGVPFSQMAAAEGVVKQAIHNRWVTFSARARRELTA